MGAVLCQVPPMPKIPTSRLARTAKFGGLVAGQSARWAGTQAANRLRSDEQAEAADAKRALALADELVTQLGQMKGAAMKLGQVLSTIDFELVPEGEREAFKEKLSSLRDDAPQVPFKKMEKVIVDDLGGSIDEHFSAFDSTPVAAASIGQVYRAALHDGRDVAVKVQYPGVAEAVETDLRNAAVLLPLVKRLAPGLDAKAILRELRDRIGEELDYELEAQNQRRVARSFKDHPFIRVPDVVTSMSTRRVLITEFVEGRGFAEVKELPEAERDRFAEICFRFFYGLVRRERIAAGDPHPGNYLLGDDGRVCFLDFGLIRRMDADYLDGERAVAHAVINGDADGVHRGLATLGYLPDPAAFDPERVLGQLAAAGEWYFTTGFRRLDPEYVRTSMELSGSPASPYFEEMRRQTIPPQALLLRRMEGLLFSVLGELRAGADWGTLALEYIADEAPSTELGRAEGEWLGASA
jgi:predicted unusual protein kinase regulating ubiquinone biosynthesis (AarF/ABC1/UbiB family)